MTYEQINKRINECKKGTIHTISYTKELKTRKGVTDKIEKRTKTQGRFGVTYDNIKTVKESREEGYLPAENAGLPKGTEWLDDRRLFIKSVKTGAIQLRVARANGNKTITEYYKNGVLVDKSEVEPLCLKSEFPDYTNKTPSPIFNIGIEKVTEIR